jgi:hypothetical protein
VNNFYEKALSNTENISPPSDGREGEIKELDAGLIAKGKRSSSTSIPNRWRVDLTPAVD